MFVGSSLAALCSLCIPLRTHFPLLSRAHAMAPRRKEQEEKLRVLLAEVEAELRSRGASPEVRRLSLQRCFGNSHSLWAGWQQRMVVSSTAAQTSRVATINAQVQKYVADVLRQHYTRYNDYMSKEADMRRELQRYVTTLEVDSRNCVFLNVLYSKSGTCGMRPGMQAGLAAGALIDCAKVRQARKCSLKCGGTPVADSGI
jgi:hypothetical protein